MFRHFAAATCTALALMGPLHAQSAGTAPQIDHQAVTEQALGVLEQQFGAFRDAANALSETARAHCDGAADEAELKEALRTAWLAWAPLDSYQFGPIETQGAALTVNFWPDKKNFVGRALDGLMALPQAQQSDPSVVAKGSAAAQGLPALERLLYTDLEPCPAAIGISGYMSQTAHSLYDAWFAAEGWADLARAAGPDNPVYLSPREFTKTLYTAVDFGLVRIIDSRIGRPLGTFERHYPRRAEAWRAGLTNEIIASRLAGLEALVALGLSGGIGAADGD